MIEVQIKTSLPDSCALGALNEVLENSILKIEGLTKIDDNIKGLLNVKAQEIEKVLANLPSYCEGVALSPQEAKVLIKEHTCLVAYPILESGCLITNAELVNRNIVWSVICDDSSFISLMRMLDEAEVEFEIVYKGKPEDKSEVTYREEEILRIALEKGYFDFPKKIKLEDLANYFGVAPSTLSEILRRGQRKVLKKYFSGR